MLFWNKKIRNVIDVSAWRMCIGCGACKAVCPKHRIVLRDIVTEGIRPVSNEIECDYCGKCLSVCPGISIINDISHPDEQIDLKSGWGSILQLYEGFSSDPEIRFNGSSGGVANGLALFCIEKLGAKRVVHVTADEGVPWINKTTISTRKDQLLKAGGSRYSPASPAEGIEIILASEGKSVFIGKPCDIAAYYKACIAIPALTEKTMCTIGVFCAGTPSTQGSLDLIKKLKIEKEQLAEFRYRGRGWPGMCAIRLRGESDFINKMTYMQSWGFIQKYRPLRCYQCPDGTSEFADVSCGDAWHQKGNVNDPGTSLVLVRTCCGRDIINNAIKEGYVDLKLTIPKSLLVAQKNLLSKRSWIWGRILMMRLLCIPTPEFKGFSLFILWMKSPLNEKMRSIYSTLRRAVQRKYWKPTILN